ncbi:unnamed protein product [Danaus chrysippus]|uniref:(African queen) hypothetical protein n=1 Tax=Danaus chrysippus TaxID=151541 RepID=A0A8J2RC09_9NEOP|nr:unnamed protein product [Danaus chrysippus]
MTHLQFAVTAIVQRIPILLQSDPYTLSDFQFYLQDAKDVGIWKRYNFLEDLMSQYPVQNDKKGVQPLCFFVLPITMRGRDRAADMPRLT